MKYSLILKVSVFFLLFSSVAKYGICQGAYSSDSLILLSMVQARQFAMEKKDIPGVMKQFADDATFINPAGYFYGNKKEIESYYNTLTHLDSINYNYSTGSVELRMLDSDNALIYYPWRMDWYHLAHPADTLYKEFGLFSITAQKRNTNWYWIAVTDQHTPDFFDDLYENKGIAPPKKQEP